MSFFLFAQLHLSTDVYILCQNQHLESAKFSDHIRSLFFGTHNLFVSGFQRCILASHFVSWCQRGHVFLLLLLLLLLLFYIIFFLARNPPSPLPPAHPRNLHFANKEMSRQSWEEIEGRPTKQRHFSFVCCCSDCHTPGALGVYRPSAVPASQVQSLFPCKGRPATDVM